MPIADNLLTVMRLYLEQRESMSAAERDSFVAVFNWLPRACLITLGGLPEAPKTTTSEPLADGTVLPEGLKSE